jgi:hypothetical protein
MAGPGFLKRQKELKREEKAQQKSQRRDERERAKADRPKREAGEDPDIAGIVPGPQPILEE